MRLLTHNSSTVSAVVLAASVVMGALATPATANPDKRIYADSIKRSATAQTYTYKNVIGHAKRPTVFIERKQGGSSDGIAAHRSIGHEKLK